MMIDGIEREAKLIVDGFDAVGGGPVLAVGPYAEKQAALCVDLCTRTNHLCAVAGLRRGAEVPRGVSAVPYDADDLWRYSAFPPPSLFRLVAVDRAYSETLLFGIFTSIVPLLNSGGIILVHSYSDFFDDEPYRCQNRSLVAIASFLRVNRNFSRRALAGQVIELSKGKGD